MGSNKGVIKTAVNAQMPSLNRYACVADVISEPNFVGPSPNLHNFCFIYESINLLKIECIAS